MEKTKLFKIIFIGTMLVLPIVLVGCQHDSLSVKETLSNVEYGAEIPTNVDNYLDLEGLNEEDKANVLAKTKLTIENAPEDGKYAVGEYTVKLVYGEEEKIVKVSVADTTKPEFKDYVERVKTVKGVKPDYTKYYSGTDLSEVTVSVDDSVVDYNKVGEYPINVDITDASHNTDQRPALVVVEAPTIKLNKTAASMKVKDTLTLKPTVKGKDSKVTYTSSNKAVASVDSKGKVTAKKKGTATITAEANGVKATCKVTVKNAPSGSKTTTKKTTTTSSSKKSTKSTTKSNGSSKKSTKSNSSSSSSVNYNTSNVDYSKASVVKSIVAKVNAERAKEGLSAMKWKSSIETITKIRSVEIVDKFDHTRPDGTRVSRTYHLAEILAGNYYSEESVIKAWMNSPSHRACIMHKNYKYMCAARYGNYWVILFSR